MKSNYQHVLSRKREKNVSLFLCLSVASRLSEGRSQMFELVSEYTIKWDVNTCRGNVFQTIGFFAVRQRKNSLNMSYLCHFKVTQDWWYKETTCPYTHLSNIEKQKKILHNIQTGWKTALQWSFVLPNYFNVAQWRVTQIENIDGIYARTRSIFEAFSIRPELVSPLNHLHRVWILWLLIVWLICHGDSSMYHVVYTYPRHNESDKKTSESSSATSVKTLLKLGTSCVDCFKYCTFIHQYIPLRTQFPMPLSSSASQWVGMSTD